MKQAAWLAFLLSTTLSADIVTDGSLGEALVLSGPDFDIHADLGQVRENNLFHSFTRFNLAQDEKALFSGADSIQNIIARVTGGQASYIDGHLVSNIPKAHLYLLNPAGLSFGAHAQLDIDGAFHASTSDYLRLADGAQFFAQLDNTSSLSVAQPAAFGFLGASSASLDIEGSLWRLPPRNTLSLTSAQINISQDAEIRIDSGTLALTTLAAEGEVGLTAGMPAVSNTSGTLNINDSLLATSGEGSGNLYIQADQFTVSDSGLLQANSTGTGGGEGIRVQVNNMQLINGGQLVSSTSGSGGGGGVYVQVAERAEFSGEDIDGAVSGLNARSLAKRDGQGSPAGIQLQAKSLILRDGAAIEARVAGNGEGADIDIQVTDVLQLTGEDKNGAGSFISTNTSGSGNGGALNIQAGDVLIENGGLIVAGSVDQGHGSPVSITAERDVVLAGRSSNGQVSAIFTNSESQAAVAGNASRLNIDINAQTLHLRDGSQMVADTGGPGQGGNITLNVSELNLEDGASLSTNSFGHGAAGILSIQAHRLNMTGYNSRGGCTISSSAMGNGSGGLVDIAVQQLNIRDGGQIGTNAFGNGAGGDTQIVATDSVVFHGVDALNFASGIFSAAKGAGNNAGDAGNISLDTDSLQMSEQAAITAGTFSTGRGGDIKIRANALNMNSDSIISSSSADIGFGEAGQLLLEVAGKLLMTDSAIQTTTASADGGNLEVHTGSYSYLTRSNLTTSVQAEAGNGGNIRFDTLFLIQKRAPVIARAVGGDGGNIDISTKGVFQFVPRLRSPIDASSNFGLDGTVDISSPDSNFSGALTVLPTGFNENVLRTSQCTLEEASSASRFAVLRRKGVPPAENDLMPVQPRLSQP